jgi:glycosyltransferase involved in cell wall biosynthesis
MPIPFLILSDAPTSGTGLGRITRDLASRISLHMSDVLEVGTLGYGGSYSKALPFSQYSIVMQDWVVQNLPEVWADFSGNKPGILFVIWDSSRVLWLSRPENCPDSRLREWLQTKPFRLFTYSPIDATGPHDRLTAILRHTLEGFDRVLAYSKWSADILDRTFAANGTVQAPIEHLPHGIDKSMFYPRPRVQARHGFGHRIGAKDRKGRPLSIPDDALFVGIVATNQARKDFGLGVQVVAELAKERNVMLWIHTDILERNWSIPALLNDFGLLDKTVVSVIELSDDQMAWCLSACDVTLGVGLGEGFGFPIFESLACGTPCIHGNYGGAAEHIPYELQIAPLAYRTEGVYNCIRPVFGTLRWKEVIESLNLKTAYALPAELDWNNLWPRWEKWLREGIA